MVLHLYTEILFLTLDQAISTWISHPIQVLMRLFLGLKEFSGWKKQDTQEHLTPKYQVLIVYFCNDIIFSLSQMFL